tara:strand:- start:3394 stop:4095 length:702 start_codon:yes stop_codon:yes gene_type:complete
MAAPTIASTADFKLDILSICEEAWERAGKEMRTGYDLRTARRSLQIMFLEWSNLGINLWTVEEASLTLVVGTAEYSLADDCIDVMDAILRSNPAVETQQDYNLTRLSVTSYAQTSNKLIQSRPTSYYVDRANRPTMTLYPVPDDATQTINYWYLSRIADLGVNTNNIDMPERFVPAAIAGLAVALALKTPELTQRVQLLKPLYDEAFNLAAEEDRSKTSLIFSPQQDFVEVIL